MYTVNLGLGLFGTDSTYETNFNLRVSKTKGSKERHLISRPLIKANICFTQIQLRLTVAMFTCTLYNIHFELLANNYYVCIPI